MPFTSKSGREAGRKSKKKSRPELEVIRENFALLVQSEYPKIKRELKKLQGEAYLRMVLKISEYVLPKLRSEEQRLDLSKLSDQEIDELLTKVIEKIENER